MKNIHILFIGLLVVLFLSGCGWFGNDDEGGETPIVDTGDGTPPPPPTGFIETVKTTVATAPDDTEAVTLGSIQADISETTEPEPI